MLQSGVAVSVLLMYTSGQIGSTYGGFNTPQEQDSSIGLCSVFPGEIERLLTEFSGHLRTVNELKASLQGYNLSGTYNSSFNNENESEEELTQAAEDVSAQLLQAGSEITALEKQLSLNAGVWQQILQEMGRAAAILHQLGGYMENLDPGCLEIRDTRFFGQIEESLQSSGILSESMNETLSGIIHYLNSIHDIGGSLPTGNPDRVLLQDGPGFRVTSVITAVYSDDSGMAPELQATYSQLNSELTAARDNLASTIFALQKKQSEIAGAQAALREQAKALAEAKEKAAAEQALKAKEEQKEEEPPAGGVTPPPSPAPSSPPPSAEASAAQSGAEPPTGEQPSPGQTASPQPEAAAPVPSPAPVGTADPGQPLPETAEESSPVLEPGSGQPAATPVPLDSPAQPSPAPLTHISKGGD